MLGVGVDFITIELYGSEQGSRQAVSFLSHIVTNRVLLLFCKCGSNKVRVHN